MAPLPERRQLTVDAIYRAYEDRQDAGFREHLGASVIGDKCDRAIWYKYRWATRARFTGRMLRLFRSGHLEEIRLVDDLRSIGVKVLALDPETGKQWKLRDDSGHFGGEMDTVAIGFPEAPATWHLAEFKTHNIKNFTDLKKNKLKMSKPQHWVQMQSYMHLAGLERGMYFAVCKDTDEIYQERIQADPAEGVRLVAKARRIIETPRPPSRISDNPCWFECKFCDHHAACWEDGIPERHCRSCLHSTPVQNGQWHCEKHDKMLSLAEQKEGCSSHRYIPDFIKGEQTDGADDGSWIEYVTVDGTVWRDVGPVEV